MLHRAFDGEKFTFLCSEYPEIQDRAFKYGIVLREVYNDGKYIKAIANDGDRWKRNVVKKFKNIGDVMTTTQLNRKARMTGDDLNFILKELVNSGILINETILTKGRPVNYWKLL